MIRYGMVGVGGFAETWARSLQMLEEKGIARLAAAAERRTEPCAAQIAALRARGCAIYTSLDEMLAAERGALDVIGLPVGIAQHEPLATRLMQAGYPVVVEKPVAGTIQEVDRLITVERQTGRWCAVDYQWLHSPTIQWLRQRIAAGALGAVREGRTVIGWPRAASYYARNAWAGQLRDGAAWVLDGPATNATAHYLTNVLYLLAAQPGGSLEIASVRAELYRAKPIPSYDTACIEVRMACGARLLHLSSHSVSESIEPVMTLEGERGVASWRSGDDTALIRYADGREESFSTPDPAYNHARSLEQAARVAAGQDPKPICGLAEGRPHVLTINLAFESSGTPRQIASEYIAERRAGDGSALVVITGMEQVLFTAYQQGAMFSDLGLPWASPSPSISAAGYTHYPRNN